MDDIFEYDRKKYLLPLWKGTTVYGESLCVIEDAFGEIRPFRLAYPVERVLSVRSGDFSVVYEEGKDFTVNGYGELEILRGGKIPYLAWNDYRLKQFDAEKSDQIAAADGIGAYRMGELFADSEGMRRYQLAVSYTHKESALYDITQGKSEAFARFFAKLNERKAACVVSYGDSITYGWAASGMQDIGKPPYCKKYADMAVEELQARFHAEIEHINLSVSGKCTDWAEADENVKGVVSARPDLVILAFGMNDAGVFRPCVFAQRIKNIIAKIRAENPFTEFLLVSPILPNPLVGFSSGSSILHYHREYPRVFAAIERETEGCACANVTAVHSLLLERKRLQDTLSNNVNHPNDFMHRIYAQVVLKTMLGNAF